MKKLLKFAYVFAVVLLSAYLSSVFSRYGTRGWYQLLDKPDIVPPDFVFPIIWTLIYALIIAATFIMLSYSKSWRHNLANDLFLAQSFLQILWCYAFFAHGYLALGMVIIIMLFIAVLKMTQLYYQLNQLAGYLLVPYCLWLMFAAALNGIYIWEYGMNAVIGR
ncbi:MAG: tryptophan-rich sensory protein [Alphaproteobacteria bacterium]|nr:tryptophan-rich sensory protein [Alphaproteobacteria bacterium]MBQ9234833.1 tryptophan-rich sensory protein [Alphaproteobacteria bacterium]